MQVPLDITFQNSEPSETIRSEVEKQAKRLEKFHDPVTSCHVTVIAPTMKRRHGDLFKIDILVAHEAEGMFLIHRRDRGDRRRLAAQEPVLHRRGHLSG
jgi:ribosome-associated translation inhibitor RaiA